MTTNAGPVSWWRALFGTRDAAAVSPWPQATASLDAAASVDTEWSLTEWSTTEWSDTSPDALALTHPIDEPSN